MDSSDDETDFVHLVLYIVLASLVGLFVVLASAVKIYNKVTNGKCRSYDTMVYKTVIVTGPTSGLGKETALNMALRGARVILGCRNLVQGRATAEEITRRTGNDNIQVVHLDVSSLFSIRQFADRINREESRLDVLINNAGVGALRRRTVSADNLEVTFVTNYLGPFLLTNLLLDLLKRSAPSRVVNVSSMAYLFGQIEFGNLNAEVDYNRLMAYCNSKLALNLFTGELAKRLQRTNDDVTVNCLHPGICNTNIWRHFYGPIRWLLKTGIWAFYKSPREGAQTAIYLAVSSDVDGITGEYFADCKKSMTTAKSKDEAIAKRLFEYSEKCCQQIQNDTLC